MELEGASLVIVAGALGTLLTGVAALAGHWFALRGKRVDAAVSLELAERQSTREERASIVTYLQTELTRKDAEIHRLIELHAAERAHDAKIIEEWRTVALEAAKALDDQAAAIEQKATQ